MPTAIEFNHVSKQYRLGLVSTKTLSHDIRRFWITNVLHKEDPYLKIGETNDRASKGTSDYVWALRDIDFKVEQGDVVGIIGKNGAGKSTLLKLLSRVTGPTTGTIRAHGRIGSLLEVGTGFHGEMTGRENIFMNGAILGMTRSEIQAKLDEIIDFSGCERYIDTPVKRYSSGMTVRLGFAVAAFLEPEILVVDEVLAVGDAEFQKKAIGKMKDVSQGSIRQLCTRGILLENGKVKSMGGVNQIVEEYLQDNVGMYSADGTWTLDKAPGRGGIKVTRCAVEYEGTEITADKPFDLVYEFYCEQDGLLVGLNPHIYNQQEICLFNIGSGHRPLEKGFHKAVFHIPGGLMCPGSYHVDNLFYSRASEYFFHRNAHAFVIENIGKMDFTNYNGVIFPSMVKTELL